MAITLSTREHFLSPAAHACTSPCGKDYAPHVTICALHFRTFNDYTICIIRRGLPVPFSIKIFDILPFSHLSRSKSKGYLPSLSHFLRDPCRKIFFPKNKNPHRNNNSLGDLIEAPSESSLSCSPPEGQS